MPPRFKFTKEQIVAAALALTREEGASVVTARAVAARLGASPKVIFGLFENMEALQQAVLEESKSTYERYVREELSRGVFPPYKCTGMAYIRFAQEERELFRLLYMRDRSGEQLPDDQALEPILTIIQQANDMTHEQALLLHMEMWICVHGIATMLATSYQPMDWDLISRVVTDVYQGARDQIKKVRD